MATSTTPNWAARWREIYETQAEQQARTRGTEGDFWGARSDIFSRAIDAPDPVRDMLLSRTEPGDTVLDVGAGSGRYSIPFATKAREVIAIEPSAGMRDALASEAAKRGLKNIRTEEADWLKADVPPADIVLAAHVLYFTPDAVQFVRKLDEHTRRFCAILIRVDQMRAGFGALYEGIWGEPEAPEPSFIDFYNLLYELGIVADVSIHRGGGGPNRFESIEQAEEMAARFLSPPNDAARAKIRPYLEARLRPTPDGALAFPEGGPRLAVVSWTR
ncbi:MAG: class I SAM-dependent methyltransferase [Dehalococcoidia bacterium]